MKKRKQNQALVFVKKHAVIVSVALGLLIVLGLTVRHSIQINTQKTTFLETQTTLFDAMNEVAIEVPGGKRASEAYCDRSSVKYGEGERSCFISEDILYPIETDQFFGLMDEIQILIAGKIDADMNNRGPDNLTHHIGDYSFSINGLSCYVEYYGLENRSSFSYLDEISDFENGLRVSLSCSGPAMADYFPSVD